AGLLERLDWPEAASRLERVKEPGRLFEVLVAAVDPESGLRLLRGEVSPSRAVELAALAARVLAGIQVASAGGVVVEHPKPSRSHGLGAVAVVYETVDTGAGQEAVTAVASYDGESLEADTLRARVSLDQASRAAQLVVKHLDRLLSQGLRVAFYGPDQYKLLNRLLSASYTGVMLLRAAEQQGKLLDAARLAAEKAGDATPVLLAVEPRIRGYLDWAAKARKRGDVEELENALESLARALAEAAYRVALAALKGSIRLEARKGINRNKR
ncbi:MAG: hypothetical protein GXO15_06650, partial [Crenarchaeota archaeon]|nr:hypothetical protein [Thermoproteota archaeon]